MAIRAVIFDYDGTTCDSFPQALRVIRELITEHNGPLHAKAKELEIRRCWGYAAERAFKNAFPGANYDAIQNQWVSKITADHVSNSLDMMTGAYETFSLLREKGIVLILATNRKAKHLISNIPPSLNLSAEFDIVQTVFDRKRPQDTSLHHQRNVITHYPKPDKMAYEPTIEILQKEFGISRGEIIAVGDTLVDLEAARAAEIGFIGVLSGPVNTKLRWLRWSAQKGLAIEEKNVISSIKDLPAWLKVHIL